MELSAALCIRPGVTAIIGSGGKTTLLYALARGASGAKSRLHCVRHGKRKASPAKPAL